MNLLRLSCLLCLSVSLCGCSKLLFTPKYMSDPIKRPVAQVDDEPRDEDSIASRVALKTKEAGQATSAALNPASWKPDPNSPAERQRQAAIRRKQKLKQSQPNAFVRWMFPDPKPPRTVGEWLSQDRVDM